jgi:hypothetical protein
MNRKDKNLIEKAGLQPVIGKKQFNKTKFNKNILRRALARLFFLQFFKNRIIIKLYLILICILVINFHFALKNCETKLFPIAFFERRNPIIWKRLF